MCIFIRFKPLIHALLEEMNLTHVEDMVIHYPVIEGVSDIRFLLEAYPVQDLLMKGNAALSPCRSRMTSPITSSI